MLLSSCPNCAAQFKVAPEQLNVRQGRVMCGRCRNVFNAFESLKRIEDGGTSETIDYSVVDSRRTEPLADAISAGNGEPTVSESNISGGMSGPLLVAETQFEIPSADMPPDSQADKLRDNFDGSDAAEHHRQDAPDRTLSDQMPNVVGATDGGNIVAGFSDDAAGSVDMPESDNPLIAGPMPVIRSEHGSRHWRWLGGLAGAVLAMQTLYFFRSEIVQQYPPLRPHFVAACKIAGCTVAFGRDANAIKIESSDLIEPPGKPGRILLTAAIANRGNTPHDFPFLEVKLMDANNTVLSSRVLSPGEYLGRLPTRDESIAANAELYVNLNLELAGKSPASGYGLRAFYP